LRNDTSALTNDALALMLANDGSQLNHFLVQGAAAMHPEIYNQWRPASNMEVGLEFFNAGSLLSPVGRALTSLVRTGARTAVPTVLRGIPRTVRTLAQEAAPGIEDTASALATKAKGGPSQTTKPPARKVSTPETAQKVKLSREQLDYLEEPYDGEGSHYYRKAGYQLLLPFSRKKIKLPPFISNSPMNRLKPRGIKRGPMYELHFKVDPDYYASALPARVGGGRWHGEDLGFEKYSPLGQLWHGAPGPLKATLGGILAAGTLGYELLNGTSSNSPAPSQGVLGKRGRASELRLPR
jgi:hypothetical protein